MYHHITSPSYMSKREAPPDHIQHRCPSKVTSILYIQWHHHIQASIPNNAANRPLVPPLLPLPFPLLPPTPSVPVSLSIGFSLPLSLPLPLPLPLPLSVALASALALHTNVEKWIKEQFDYIKKERNIDT